MKIQNLKKYSLSFLLVSSLLTTAHAEGDKKAAAKICPSERGTEIPFPPGVTIEVDEYTDATRTYKVFASGLAGEGIPDVTLEAMADSISTVKKNYELAFKNPQDIIGEKYKVEKTLKVLTDEETEARKGCTRQKGL